MTNKCLKIHLTILKKYDDISDKSGMNFFEERELEGPIIRVSLNQYIIVDYNPIIKW